jgi:fimbrial chaperone protein
MTGKSIMRAGLVATALVSFAFAPARAISVQPLALDMVALGGNSRATIQAVNDGAKPMPVEVAVKKLDLGPNGEMNEKDAGDEFLVFPPQAVIPAGATQNFRIQWVGAPDIKKSQTYVVYVNQIPVKMKAGESGVQMVFNFGVLVSVAPSGAQSAMKLVGAEAATEGKKRGAAITVENPSTMYSYFGDAKLTLESGSWRKVLGPGELRQLVGYSVVEPGKRRRILVPVDVPEGAGKISASLEYKPVTAK